MAAVFAYRVILFWLPLVAGAVAFAALRRDMSGGYELAACNSAIAAQTALTTSAAERRRSLSTPAAGLLLRAVVGLMLGEEHGLDRGPAARARLAFAAVHLERHRQFVGDLLADHLLVVLERVAEHVERRVQPLDLLFGEL